MSLDGRAFLGLHSVSGMWGENGPRGLQQNSRCRSSGHPPAGGSPFLTGIPCLMSPRLYASGARKGPAGSRADVQDHPTWMRGPLCPAPSSKGTDSHSCNPLWLLGVSLQALLTQLSPQYSGIFTGPEQDKTVQGNRRPAHLPRVPPPTHVPPRPPSHSTSRTSEPQR